MGADCAERLGISKWIPPVPVEMTGKAHPCTWPAKFDVDAWQKQPDAFAAGDPVQVTEKLHGTFCLLGYHGDEGAATASKSMAGELSFDPANPDNEHNLYVRAWRQHDEKIVALAKQLNASMEVLGEIVGPEVQDLHYELSSPTFFGFDVRVDGAEFLYARIIRGADCDGRRDAGVRSEVPGSA